MKNLAIALAILVLLIGNDTLNIAVMSDKTAVTA